MSEAREMLSLYEKEAFFSKSVLDSMFKQFSAQEKSGGFAGPSEKAHVQGIIAQMSLKQLDQVIAKKIPLVKDIAKEVLKRKVIK